jgi:hypothetical protein
LHKPSQHGLGHLVNPIDPAEEADDRSWIDEVRKQMLTGRVPGWGGKPAIADTRISTPSTWRLFDQLNQDKTQWPISTARRSDPAIPQAGLRTRLRTTLYRSLGTHRPE